ncbi:MAG: isoleucine--tRNA ligase [Deltaproteobacteria bacterium]|jgi:isoleucyl-tRNA synthetase|nr:isoleucine--tRNA ligase [Deltaproteobacteria bacterium]MBT4526832.1 isoleucine--tRNA ligase [Deltaproteobacteria bacterium]
MFKTINNKKGFPTLEEEVLEFWDDNNTFEKSINERSDDKVFFFYDGPPFATGLPHYGHLIAGTIKDVVPRYQTMLGMKVERKFGWDCHGLPVEFEVEKELGLKGKLDIEALGIDKFNEHCRSIVLRYSNEWRRTIKRIGRWIDMDNDYKTMDVDFMESIWWVFKTLWEKKLIYESKKIVAYSPRLSTPLSNFEVNLGYQDVQDPSVTIKFKSSEEENTYFLAWTTTPWTLPANLALTVNPEVTYAKVKSGDSFYYLAKELAVANFGRDAEIEFIGDCLGKDLEGKSYEPILPYYEDFKTQGAFKVLLGDHATTEAGTGIVHTAPSFGEDDFQMGEKFDLPQVMPVDEVGNFNEEAPDLEGQWFKDADKTIMKRLKAEDKVFAHKTVVHSYPFCWRSGAPLMYRTIRSWFLDVEAIKDLMIENNQSINWSPEHIKNGRMGKWLESARAWAISRNRYWGNPIPVWICEDCGHQICFGSRAELEEASGKEMSDLHSHFIDPVKLKCEKCQSQMTRTTEVLDCWFESGSMPYGQQHYPFENKEVFERNFPADFISEGLDQTRGWFYTLQVLSTALFGKPAFKNCIVNGMVLAEDGKKMSKSLKNFPDPWEMLNKFGADAIRLYMLNSGAIRAEELLFSEAGLQETLRNNMLPLWNVLSFFTTYANIDQWQPELIKSPDEPENPLDKWILSQLHSLIQKVRTSMDAMNLNKSVAPFVGFIDMLTNWYVRRSRRRFWKAGQGHDKEQAYKTLYTVLLELSKVIAPFIPFLAENIYQVIKQDDMPESVHLCFYPESNKGFRDEVLESEMDIILRSVNMGRALRSKHQLKVRQPLQSITLLTKDSAVKGVLDNMSDLIMDELNLKEVKIAENEEDLVHLSAKPNLKVLGPKLGKKLSIVRPQIEALSANQIVEIQKGSSVSLDLGDESFDIGIEELFIQKSQKEEIATESDGDLTVALDIQLSDELIFEGQAREFVNKIQLTRKEQEFDVTDRILIHYQCDEKLSQSILKYQNYITQETLADELVMMDKINDEFIKWDINGVECQISVIKK